MKRRGPPSDYGHPAPYERDVRPHEYEGRGGEPRSWGGPGGEPYDAPYGPPPGADPYFDAYGPPAEPLSPHLMGGPPPPAVPQELPQEPILIFEIPIPKAYSGIVIGPGGGAASRIRKQARCQLHVRRNVLPGQSGEIQIVEVKGNTSQCQAGVAAVRDIIQEQHPDAEVEALKEVSCHLDVLPAQIGPVLGAKGVVARGIREKSGASVKVRELNPETGLQTISIIGREEQVKNAYVMIKDILDKFDPSLRSRGVRDREIRGPPPPAYQVGPAHLDGPPHLMHPRDAYHPPPPHRGGGSGDRYYEPPSPPRQHYRPPPSDYRYALEHPGGGAGSYPPYDRGGPGPMYSNVNGGNRPMGREMHPAAQGAPDPARAQSSRYGGAAAGGGNPTAAAIAAAAETGAQILLLQPDGTYKPAHFMIGPGGTIVQTGPPGAAAAPQQQQQQAAAVPPTAAAPAATSGSTLLSGLQAALAQYPGLAQYVQQQQAAHQQQQGGAPAAAAGAAGAGAPVVLSQSMLSQMAAALSAGSAGGASSIPGLSQLQSAYQGATDAAAASPNGTAAASGGGGGGYQQPYSQQYYQQAAAAPGGGGAAAGVQYGSYQQGGGAAAGQYGGMPPQQSGYATQQQPAAAASASQQQQYQGGYSRPVYEY